MAGSGSGGASDCIACYRGSVVVRLRAYTYHGKGTAGGEMRVYQDRLEFQGVGIYRWTLRKYEISRERIERVQPLWTPGMPWWKFFDRRRGIRVVSKPGGAFGDRDEYCFAFDWPSVEEVLGTVRAAGYPVPAGR